MKKGWTIIFIIVVVGLALTIGNLKRYKYDDGNQYAAGSTRIADKVEDIEINWVAGKVSVIAYDGDEIILSENADENLPEKKKMHWQLDGNTLRVQYVRSGIFNLNIANKELTVMVPESLLLDDVDITVVSARLDVEGICADQLKIETVSGSVKADCERVNEVKADAVSGSVVLQFEHAPEKIKVATVSGGVKIRLPKDAGFEVEMDSVSGRMNSSFSTKCVDDDTYVYGDGGCSIDVETVSGSLMLDELK